LICRNKQVSVSRTNRDNCRIDKINIWIRHNRETKKSDYTQSIMTKSINLLCCSYTKR
jgi:hypothetical protein